MTTSLQFRSALAKRVFLAATMFGSSTLLGCGDSGTGSGAGPAGGAGEGAAGEAAGGQAAGGEAAGGAPANGGASAGAEGPGGAGGAPAGQENVERCFANPLVDAACPVLADAPTYFSCTDTYELVLAWLSGPVAADTLCCYQVDVSAPNDPQCVGGVGRPFMVESSPARARVVAGDSPRSWQHGSVGPSVADLTPATRAALAKVWADDASYEHASVASFAKFSLELLAFGAPAELVRRAHEAALDEVRHAELGFALASAYAGHALAPSKLTEAASMRCCDDIESFLRAVIREGCIGETLAAVVASAQQSVARDAAVRDALAIIARDEASHAELAWQTVAWVLKTFGPATKDVARHAFDAAIDEALSLSPPLEIAEHAHGRLSTEEQRHERERALREVVRPAMSAILAS